MNKSVFLFIFLPLLVSCSDYEFRDTDTFNLKANCIKSGTDVELIHFSGGPDKRNEDEFYYQYIVRNVSTGDTVRVLSMEWHDFDQLKKLGESVKFYFTGSPQNPQNMLNIFMNDSSENNVIDESIIESKVCVYKPYKEFETQNFPTTVGSFVASKTNSDQSL